MELKPPIVIRPRDDADNAQVVALYNAQESDGLPLSLERYQDEYRAKTSSPQQQQWVAMLADVCVGYGAFHPAWWTEDPNIYSLEIRVREQSARQGIGTQLYQKLHSNLLTTGARRLLTWVREDSPAGQSFAAKMGFQRTGQTIQEYRLYTPDVALDRFLIAQENLAQKGIRITTLAEQEPLTTSFLHRLYQLCCHDSDISVQEPVLEAAFEGWREATLNASGVSPHTYWIAMEGEQPVGVTFLKRLSTNAAENDYTGVASTHRRLGIATALKGQAMLWAQQEGVEWFYTSSEIENTPMIVINTSLGYRPGAVRQEMGCEIASPTS